jgi:Tol biopolymer transport system component
MRRATLGLLVVAAMLLSAPPAFATFPGQNGKFAVYSAYQGRDAIGIRNPDGSGFLQVTTPPPGAGDTYASWSPDGQRLAFQRFFSADTDIWIVNADGTGATNVTQTPDNSESEVSWSADGTKLVFFRCCWSISVINADGTGLTPLATPPPNTLYRRPKWSPDGTKVAFKGGPFNNEHDIYTVNADGSGLVNITNTPSFVETAFDWSPDGTKIVFAGYSSSDPSSDLDVYVMNSDGSGRVDVTPDPSTYDGDPVFWSPDGTHLLFLSSRDPRVFT